MNIATATLLLDTWGMHGDDVGTGWMIVMMIAMVLFWGAIIVGVFWLVRGGIEGWRTARTDGRETAIEILEKRFAAGEISPEEYRARRDTLSGQPSHG